MGQNGVEIRVLGLGWAWSRCVCTGVWQCGALVQVQWPASMFCASTLDQKQEPTECSASGCKLPMDPCLRRLLSCCVGSGQVAGCIKPCCLRTLLLVGLGLLGLWPTPAPSSVTGALCGVSGCHARVLAGLEAGCDTRQVSGGCSWSVRLISVCGVCGGAGGGGGDVVRTTYAAVDKECRSRSV